MQRLSVVFAHLAQPYQPSPKGLSGRPAHRPFRGLLGVHSRCGPYTRAVTYSDPLHRRLQPFRYLHDCSGCFRLERSGRVGLAPTGKRRLVTAHTHCGHSDRERPRDKRPVGSLSARSFVLSRAAAIDGRAWWREPLPRIAFATASPGEAFLPNWHIEAIAHQLMRVHKGQTHRLLINHPPRSPRFPQTVRLPRSTRPFPGQSRLLLFRVAAVRPSHRRVSWRSRSPDMTRSRQHALHTQALPFYYFASGTTKKSIPLGALPGLARSLKHGCRFIRLRSSKA